MPNEQSPVAGFSRTHATLPVSPTAPPLPHGETPARTTAAAPTRTLPGHRLLPTQAEPPERKEEPKVAGGQRGCSRPAGRAGAGATQPRRGALELPQGHLARPPRPPLTSRLLTPGCPRPPALPSPRLRAASLRGPGRGRGAGGGRRADSPRLARVLLHLDSAAPRCRASGAGPGPAAEVIPGGGR